MADRWFIVQIASNYEKLVNQFIIVPSNWITFKNKTATTKFLQIPFGSEDVEFYVELAKTRGIPPESWMDYQVMRQLGNDAYSYQDAELTLNTLTNNQTICNSNAGTRVEEMINTTPRLPANVVSARQSPIDQAPVAEQGSNNLILVDDADFKALIRKVDNLAREFLQVKATLNVHTELIRMDIQQLKTFMVEKKSAAERDMIVDYETLVGRHRLKQDFLNLADDEPMDKLFSSYESFQRYQICAASNKIIYGRV